MSAEASEADMVIYQKLCKETVDGYIAYLRNAMKEEPEKMTADILDEKGIRLRIDDPFYQKTYSILAVLDGMVVGRIEYHFYGCIQDGSKMAYVDWVYVLPKRRHQGIAQGLFKQFEKECLSFGINQYYLIRAENENANRFYSAFSDVSLTEEPLLRKQLSAT